MRTAEFRALARRRPQPLHDPLAMLEVDDDGNPATWGDHVTEGEYNTAPPD